MTTRLARPTALLATTLALAFCACGTDESPEQAALSAALATWTDQAPGGYSFVSARSCECLPEYAMPIVVQVMGDTIVAATYESSGDPVVPEVMDTLYTIDGLFGVIQSAIADNAFSVVVSYDPTLGHPTNIAIDYDAQLADEEFLLTVRDFVPIQ